MISLIFDLDFSAAHGNYFGDSSGKESQAILINDFSIKLDENRHPERVKFPILSQLGDDDKEKVI